MKRMLVCLLAGAIIACFSAPTFAGTLDDVKIGLHSGGTPASKNTCTSGADAGLDPVCDAVLATSALNTQTPSSSGYYTYIFVMDIDPAAGLTAVEFALDFVNGVNYIYGTGQTNCGSAEFSAAGWPATPNQGQTITWGSCQDDVAGDPQGQAHVMAYILKCYAYAADGQTCVVPKPSTVFGAADCAASFTDLNPFYPVNAGCLGHGTDPGYQPCVGGVPVEETTWGAIKSQFEGE